MSLPMILVLLPEPHSDGEGARGSVGDDGLSPELTLVWRRVPGALRPDSAAERTVSELATLDAGLGAERDGFDAVVVASFFDLALKPLRSALSIPVVGAGRTSLLHALTLGSRFGIIVPDGGTDGARGVLRASGLDGSCAALIGFDGSPEGAAAAARDCVEAGADVLCCAADAPATEGARRAVPIPVIQPVNVAISLAGNLLALGLRHSRRAHPEPMVRKDELLSDLARAAGSV